MFRLTKKVFVVAMTFFSCNALKFVPINNQKCKVKSEIIDINSSKPSFYPYNVKISKCSGRPYVKLCVLDVVENTNVKVFNVISRTNETRYVKWHETCKCKCRLDARVCNNKQRCNEDKCRCWCKELIDKGIYDQAFISNPSNCECEFDRFCDVGEYLDYKNFKCTKRLVKECSENIDENELHWNKMIYNSTLNDYKKICSSSTVYKVLLAIFFIISIIINSVFNYFYWYLKRKNIETRIY